MPDASQPAEPSSERPASLPLVAVRDVVVFPSMTVPLSVGRERSVKAIERAMPGAKLVLVVAQKQAAVDDPQAADLYHAGTLCEVVQFLRMPDGTLKVFLLGLCRAQAANLRLEVDGSWTADAGYPAESWQPSKETDALLRHVLLSVEEYAKLSGRIPQESLAPLGQIAEPGKLADAIAASLPIKISDRQEILELLDPVGRLEKVGSVLTGEIEILNLERKIHTRVRSQIERTQKEYYLTEQMKAIQKELRQKDDFAKELDELRKKVAAAQMPQEAEAESLKELARLEKMMPFSPEATVSRTYLDWMVNLPWSVKTRDNLDVLRAQKILDEDHFSLEKIKERIVEYLAVCKLTKKLKGPILCFVGPPGVGKTSMARSIARSMGRKFARISLGGVRDEAEIRGHRRTYIGSLPGRIVQSLRKAKSRNPVILLDEIDKMGMDWRGDPAAALLEVLDPEQNHAFVDHYLDVECDLSQVMFITTANTLQGIPVSLIDRLETLRYSGYTHNEKTAIARQHLLPRQLREHGLKPERVAVTEGALDRVIHEYTQEAGVRNLERELAGLARKVARKFVTESPQSVTIAEADVPKYLGIPKFTREKASFNTVGVSTGLAWTEHGGETLAVEVTVTPGKGNVTITGKLGDVMRESCQAALTYVKSAAKELGVKPGAFRTQDFHVHVPEGAVPKDGPSAGIAIATALASQVSGRPVKPRLAMTGEITLRGRVLPIGGLKEKVIAAHREEMRVVLFPESNRKDLEEIPQDIQEKLKLVPVQHIRDVLALALEETAGKPSKRPLTLPSPRGRGGLQQPKFPPPPALQA